MNIKTYFRGLKDNIVMATVHMVLIALLLLFPYFFYKKRTRRMAKFYTNMAYNPYFRRFYAMILLFMVLVTHFTFFSISPMEYGLMVSTIVIIYIFSAKRCVSLLRGVRNSRAVMVGLFTLILALVFTPHMYTLAVSLAFILMAALFYPSARIERDSYNHHVYPTWDSMMDDLIHNYFG